MSASARSPKSLWSHGLRHLDAVVLSHADLDHYNALPGLLERFSVGAVYVSPVMFDKENPAMEELRRAIDEHHVAVREIQAGDRLHGGDGCLLEVLHPSDQVVWACGRRTPTASCWPSHIESARFS